MPELELTPDAFREVGSRWATGVAVVTTISDGFDHAMTATSFVTVSLDPMQVLICVQSNTRFHDALCTDDESHSVGVKPKKWAISILPTAASAAASWFATKGRPLHGQFDRFSVRRGPMTSAILLCDAIATLEVQTVNEYVSGDHVIVVGDVLSMSCAEPKIDESQDDPNLRPLTYWARRYRRLAP